VYRSRENTPVKITLNFISNPDITHMEIKHYYLDTYIGNSSYVQVLYQITMVPISFYGKSILMAGHSAEFYIFNFTENFEGKYLLNVTNSVGTAVHVFNLVVQNGKHLIPFRTNKWH